MKYLKKGDLIWLTDVNKDGHVIDDAYYKIIDIKDDVILTLKGRYEERTYSEIKIISLYTTNICKHTKIWIRNYVNEILDLHYILIESRYCKHDEDLCEIILHKGNYVKIEKMCYYYESRCPF